MAILLPCDLSTWPSVMSYLKVLASGLDTIHDAIVIFLQIHDRYLSDGRAFLIQNLGHFFKQQNIPLRAWHLDDAGGDKFLL